MYYLPNDLIRFIATFLNLKEASILASTCKQFVSILNSSHFWNADISNLLDRYTGFNHRLVACFLINCKDLYPLKLSVSNFSSCDGEGQVAKNVLSKSLCKTLIDHYIGTTSISRTTLGYHAQRQCGCCMLQPCYWSSLPSSSPDKEEFIDFKLSSNSAMLYGFSLTPYQAYFHPHQPIYSAVQTSLVLYKNEELIYSSAKFNLAQLFDEQFFYLPHPILVCCDESQNSMIVSIRLHGMKQRQTLDPGTQHFNDYYVTLTSVVLFGVPLSIGSFTPDKCLNPQNFFKVNLDTNNLCTDDDHAVSTRTFQTKTEILSNVKNWVQNLRFDMKIT